MKQRWRLILVLGTLSTAAGAEEAGTGAPKTAAASCIDSHFEAQRLRKESRLLESRTALATCLDEHCPSLLREECGVWLNELNTEIPRVVVSVVNEKGADVLKYTLTIDGSDVLNSGSPHEMNPGTHRIQAEAEGHRGALQEIELHAGERLRTISLQLTRESSPNDAQPRVPAHDQAQRILWPGYVLAGASLAFLGASIALGVSARNDETNYRANCLPECSHSLVDDLSRRYTLTNVGIGLAAASALGAGAWFIWAPRKGKNDEVTLKASPDGMRAHWTVRF